MESIDHGRENGGDYIRRRPKSTKRGVGTESAHAKKESSFGVNYILKSHLVTQTY